MSGWTWRFPPGTTRSARSSARSSGAVIQIRAADLDDVHLVLRAHGFKACTTRIGTLNPHFALRIRRAGQEIYNESLTTLRGIWSDVTRRIAALRDNPESAEQEHQVRVDRAIRGFGR
jgi:phosphoribosylformylglycinamidine synthase